MIIEDVKKANNIIKHIDEASNFFKYLALDVSNFAENKLGYAGMIDVDKNLSEDLENILSNVKKEILESHNQYLTKLNKALEDL